MFMHLADSDPHLALLEPVAHFQLLFNEEIYSRIACETERYASQRNDVIYLSPQEIEAFVGILLLTGYNSQPRQRLYWRKDNDITCPLISRSMSRKRLKTLGSQSILLITIIFLMEISLVKFYHYRIESMIHFSSLEYLRKIWPLMKKWSILW